MIQSLRHFIPAFLWALVIFVIISVPAGSIPSTEKLNIPHVDKIVHFFIFALLGAFTLWGFLKKKHSRARGIAISLFICILYGIGTEYLQHCCLDDRHGNLYDVAANSFGTVFGVLLMLTNTLRKYTDK